MGLRGQTGEAAGGLPLAASPLGRSAPPVAAGWDGGSHRRPRQKPIWGQDFERRRPPPVRRRRPNDESPHRCRDAEAHTSLAQVQAPTCTNPIIPANAAGVPAASGTMLNAT